MKDHPPGIVWHGLSVPKRGHSADEYEDAFAVDLAAGRLAIADGASESSFAGLWARLLVEEFVRPSDSSRAETSWLEDCRRCWAAQVDGRPLPWYAEEKRDQGAFATFLGLVVDCPEAAESGHWRAQAVGDSCLFQVRRHQLIEAFPLPRSTDFTNQPRLLGSRSTPADRQRDLPCQGQGDWHWGDRFLLMTDALAQWFLRRHEAGHKPWRALARANTAARFAGWVEDLRQGDALRNDDVTLVQLVIGDW